jgi:hypothetical protein
MPSSQYSDNCKTSPKGIFLFQRKVVDDDLSDSEEDHREVKLFVNMTGAISFGCR